MLFSPIKIIYVPWNIFTDCRISKSRKINIKLHTFFYTSQLEDCQSSYQ